MTRRSTPHCDASCGARAVRECDGGSMAAGQDLSAHVALVTGASRGIGAAVALMLAELGAAVAVNYRERAAAADVSQAAAVAKMVEQVASALGPIDILVNNAGVAIVRGVDDLTEDDFDRTIAVNLKSAFLCTQAVLPAMRARQWGRIVNISSGAARAPAPSACTTTPPRPAWKVSRAAMRRVWSRKASPSTRWRRR